MDDPIEWGDRIIFSTIDAREAKFANRIFPEMDEQLKAQFAEARERAMCAILSGEPLPRPAWTWRDRLHLAWSVLRGRVTWDDIN